MSSAVAGEEAEWEIVMIPKIDPAVRHVGISYLRKLNASQLRQLEGAIVVCDNSEPLAVIVSYETFLRIQQVQQTMMKSADVIGEYVVPRGLRQKGDKER